MIKYFSNNTGIRITAITTAQMIEVDRIAMNETGPNLFQMMENAGRSLATLAIDMLGKNWQKAKIVILAGTGGNGGGGICAARHLTNRNIDTTICISDNLGLGDVPSYQRKIFQVTQGKGIIIDYLEQLKPDLIIDSIIGYGLKSAPKGNVHKMISWVNHQDSKILSLDVPSGVDATNGITYGKFIKADRTLTLALPKTGLLPELVGELYLTDIGIPTKVYDMLGIKYQDPFGDKFIVKIK